jgi:hypothetical protein
MRQTLIGLLLLAAAAPLLGQGYGYQSPDGTVYQQVDRNTVVGSDGQVYYRRGNTLILRNDPSLRWPQLILPPGSRVVGRIADSIMIETADGQRQTCTPVGGQTICH